MNPRQLAHAAPVSGTPVFGCIAPGTISHEPQVEGSLQWPCGMVAAIVGAAVGAADGDPVIVGDPVAATRKQSAGDVAEGGAPAAAGFHNTRSLL